MDRIVGLFVTLLRCVGVLMAGLGILGLAIVYLGFEPVSARLSIDAAVALGGLGMIIAGERLAN